MTDSTPSPEIVDKLRNGVYSGLAMLAGMQLDVFTPLSNGPMNSEQLAKALGVGVVRFRPLLDALAAAGLLKVERDVYSNTPETDYFLVPGKPTYTGGTQLLSLHWTNILKTADSIRSGSPQARIDYSALSTEELEAGYGRFYDVTVATARTIVERYDLSSYRTLLDVGGGTGGLAITVTESCPNIQATVVDLPNVTPLTQRFVNEAGAADRVQVVTADAVNGPLTGSFDAAVLNSFIQVLSPDQARRALRNVSEVINPSGAIFISGRGILDDSRVAPPQTVEFNLNAINVFDEGQAHTEQEHRNWLTEAGFEGFERVTLPSGTSIISARKPE